MKLKYQVASIIGLLILPVQVLAAAPNDPLYPRQWYLKQIGAEEAWKVSIGKPSVTVALIDAGVDIYHPDLLDAFWVNSKELPGDKVDNDGNGYVDDVRGWNFAMESPDVRPVGNADTLDAVWSHGTAMMALIAARQNDFVGMSGVAPGVRVMPLVVLGTDGFGNLDDATEAIYYAIRMKADVINLSLAGFETDEKLERALAEAERAGIVVVAATGNSDMPEGFDLDTDPVYPVCGEDAAHAIIGVTGSDVLDQHAAYANVGASCTDLAAPGYDLLSARPTQEPNGASVTSSGMYFSGLIGTSAAAPLVSGAAALIKSVHPEWSPARIRAQLFAAADPIEEGVGRDQKGRLGYGRLNIGAALR